MFSWRQRGSPNQIRALILLWFGLLSFGALSLCFGQAPTNDNFTNAIVLYGNSSIFSGSLTNATFESGESTSGWQRLQLRGVARCGGRGPRRIRPRSLSTY